jgi:hypothetical protein
MSDADPVKLKIKSVVVPRAYVPPADGAKGNGSLRFHVVFTLIGEDPKGGHAWKSNYHTRPKVPRLFTEPPAEYPTWPNYIWERVTHKKCKFRFRSMEPGGKGFETAEVTLLDHPDLAAAKWSFYNSWWLWLYLVTPSVQGAGDGSGRRSDRFHSRSPVSWLLSPDLSDRDDAPAAPLVSRLNVNPASASDLRPGFRLESPEPLRVVRGLQTAQASVASAVKDAADPAGVELLLALAASDELEDFLGFLARTKSDGKLSGFARDVAAMYRREDPRFRQSVGPYLPGNAEFSGDLQQVVDAYHDYALSGGRTEFLRHARLTRGSRNRHPYGTASGAHRFAPGGSWAPDDGPLPYPSFEELLGQVRQHPGLARRLLLDIACEVPWPDSLKDVTEVASGAAWFDVVWEPPASTLEPESPFLARSLQTACQLNRGGDAPFFRAKPKYPKNFLPEGTSSGPVSDVWKRYHVMPPEYYVVTQEDYSPVQGRAEADLDPTPASATPASRDASHAEVVSLVDSVNIYAAPRDHERNPVSAAEALKSHLKRSSEHAARSHRAALRWHKNPRDRFEDVDAEPDFYAEDLIQGTTVFVQEGGVRDGAGSGPWRSLCRRKVWMSLKVPEIHSSDPVFHARSRTTNAQANEPHGLQRETVWYTFEFEEEGFVGTSLGFVPKPQTGSIVRVTPPSNGTGPRTFEVTVLKAENKAGKTQVFRSHLEPGATSAAPLVDTTRLGSLFRAVTTWADVLPRDVVLVTPTGLDRDPNRPATAAEVDVHPVFREDHDFFENKTLEDLKGVNLLTVRNRVPDPRNPKQDLSPSPRGDEAFPLVVAGHATHYLKATGQPIVPTPKEKNPKLSPGPDEPFRYFLVEGERRYYAIPRLECPAGQVRPFLPVTDAAGLPPADGPAVIGVASRLGPANVLHPVHLRASDSWTRILVPKATAAGFADPIKCADLELLGRYDGSDLALLRGKVTAVRFLLTVKLGKAGAGPESKTNVSLAGVNWKILGGALPEIPSPGTGVLAYSEILKVAGPPPADKSQEVVLRVAGTATLTGTKSLKLTPDAGNAELVNQSDQSGGIENVATSLGWVLAIELPDGTTRSVAYDNTALEVSGPSIKGRFLHPTWADRHWVEAIGVADEGGRMAGRAWPQNVLGTFDRAARTLLFPDGTSVKDLKVALGDQDALLPVVSTHFFEVALRPTSPGAGDASWTLVGFDGFTDGLVVAGEVTRAEVALGDNATLSVRTGDVFIELVDFQKGKWTVHGVTPGGPGGPALVIHPSSSALPPRPFAELELGEFLVARADVDPSARPGWVKATTYSGTPATIVRGAACLVGALAVPQISPAMIAAERADVYRPCTLTTAGGARLEVWAQGADQSLHGLAAVAASSRVIHAVTVTRFAHPTAGRAVADGEVDVEEPVHATVSEIIARWSGWALTVAQPGRADQKADSSVTEALPFRMTAFRPRPAAAPAGTPKTLFPNDADSWTLPRLRYGRPYRFALRRVDLAGNHYYDEPLPAALPDEATATFRPLAPKPTTEYLARPFTGHPERGKPYANALQAFYETRTFRRTGRPHSPVLAYPVSAAVPLYADPADVGEVPDDIEAKLGTAMELVAHQRAAQLVLITDVLPWQGGAPAGTPSVVVDGHLTLTVDASAELLPPPCPVETVLTHSLLDGQAAGVAARTIRAHERYTVDRRFGLDRKGVLNYFGDPAASKVRVRLSAGANGEPPAVEATMFETGSWPDPSRVRLALEPIARPWAPAGAVPPLGPSQLAIRADAGAQVIHLLLPPGAQGHAILEDPATPPGDVTGVWRPVSLLHATNGPWTRPAWESLEEVVPERPEPAPSTSRRFDAAFRIDWPTTGSYAWTAAWNDCWDESVPVNHRPAAAVAHVGAGGGVTEVAVTDGGHGFPSAAVVLFETAGEPTKYPVLEPLVTLGRVTSVVVHDGGAGFAGDVPLKIIRRPPFSRAAEGRVTEVDTRGGVVAVEVSDRGGWYAAPPFALVYESGEGLGAELRAKLDGKGGVGGVEVVVPGRGYAVGTPVKFYTNRHEEREHALDPPAPGTDPGPLKAPLAVPFGDPRGRDVDLVLRLNSRFRKFLRDRADATRVPAAGTAERVRYHVPRFSPPRGLPVTSRARPNRPDVAYLMPSFDWEVTGHPGLDLALAKEHFRTTATGRIAVTRRSTVRVYLFRPWNRTGPEQLGMVVMPATLNSIRMFNDRAKDSDQVVSPDDRGAYNVASSPEAVSGLVPALTAEPLTYHSIPEPLRPLVSRWGFDPAWSEAELPPLSAANLRGPATLATHDFLPEQENLPPQPVGEKGVSQAPLWLALFGVHYDGAKERWYSDVRLKLAGASGPSFSNPFVQLALVTYQSYGLPGTRVSPVALCDPIKLLGERTLEVVRHDRLRFTLTLRGEFEHPPKGRSFPRREVVARLQSRDPALAEEVVSYQPPETSAPGRVPTATLATYELKRSSSGDSYSRRVTLDADSLASAESVRGLSGLAVLSVEEYEVFPAAGGGPESPGEDLFVLDGVLCARRSVFTLALRIGPAAAKTPASAHKEETRT